MNITQHRISLNELERSIKVSKPESVNVWWGIGDVGYIWCEWNLPNITLDIFSQHRPAEEIELFIKNNRLKSLTKRKETSRYISEDGEPYTPQED